MGVRGPDRQGLRLRRGHGKTLATYQLTTGDAFINDVVVTKDAAFFTDSPNPVLFRLPLGPGGSLPTIVESLPLSGDYTHQPGALNLNGIHATPDGETLVVVQSGAGALYTVDPATGEDCDGHYEAVRVPKA